jgi:hypothetical protein
MTSCLCYAITLLQIVAFLKNILLILKTLNSQVNHIHFTFDDFQFKKLKYFQRNKYGVLR